MGWIRDRDRDLEFFGVKPTRPFHEFKRNAIMTILNTFVSHVTH